MRLLAWFYGIAPDGVAPEVQGLSGMSMNAEHATHGEKAIHLTMTSKNEGAVLRDPHEAAIQSTDIADPLSVVLASLDDSKAEDIVSIDILGKTSIADHMIVASGRSHRHVSAVADHLIRDLKKAGLGAPRVEGLPHCDWVLVDAGDIIVHLFRPEVRGFYNIEKMWSAETDTQPQYSN